MNGYLLGPVVVGIVLVAVPTAFTVFPHWATWSMPIRAVILVGWLLLAIAGVLITAVTNSRLQAALVREERRANLESHFRSLLDPSVSGLPDQYQFTVYTNVAEFFVPVYPRILSPADPAIFPTGAGATGKAWAHPDRSFAVVGDAVSSGEHGLTPEQNQRFAAFRSVAATVIRDDADARLGVLSAIGRIDDGEFTEKAAGIEVLRGLANNLSHLMSDAKIWMLPTRIEVGAVRIVRPVSDRDGEEEGTLIAGSTTSAAG